MATRTEGQIWISAESPYRLHYYVNSEDHVVSTEITYKLSDASTTNPYYKGTLLSMTSDESGNLKLQQAHFPDDIDSIVGILSKDVTDPTEDVSILTEGSLELTADELANCMLSTDLNYTTNGWKEAKEEGGSTKGKVGIGAPVYWSIGRSVKSGTTYSYEDPSDGKLTLSTPSGYKWKRIKVDDNSLNIGYDEIPQVGLVSNYTLSGNAITKLTIQINLRSFGSSITWTWPYIHDTSQSREGDCGKLSAGQKTFVLRPGIFATSNQGAKLRNYTDVVIIPEVSGAPDETNAVKALMSCTDVVTGTDRTCTLNYSTPEPFYYRISGKVSYRYDKNHS